MALSGWSEADYRDSKEEAMSTTPEPANQKAAPSADQAAHSADQADGATTAAEGAAADVGAEASAVAVLPPPESWDTCSPQPDSG